jgi:hypothetical protein
MGCASGDLDNDGDQDMVTTNYKSHFGLWKNNGNGTFTNMTNRSGVDDTGPQAGIAIADFDGDGMLDFFIAEYLRTTDRIYRNMGGWKFEDKTDSAHITDLDHGFQPIAADYDRDGDQDIYVAVDFGPDTLWKNIGNFTFADVSRATNAFDIRAGMGAAWGDWNDDGDLDVYVTNYDPNGLWDNRGGSFTDVGNSTGTDDTWTGWGTAWLDYDNDRDLDLYVANGVVDFGSDHNQPNKLFRNNADGTFTDVSENSGAETADISRGLAVGDFDADGRMDLYVLNINCPAALLHNTIQTSNNWLRVKLQGTVSNRDGVGAEVSVKIGATSTKQLMAAGSSYLSSNSKTLVFGAGSTAVIGQVTVEWPSGLRQVVSNVAVNQTITVVEADSEDPVARAANVTADQGVAFPLNGTQSSDNVRISRWEWAVNVSGTLQRTTGALANMTVYQPGVFPGSLTVTDIFGRKAAAPFTVTVRPLVRVTVDAGPDVSVAEGAVVQFRAVGASTATADYEGDCAFNWTFVDAVGPQVLLGARPSYTFGRPGLFEVRVAVVDPQNATASDFVNITVRDAQAPQLRATVPSAVDEDRPVLLDAVGTTDNDPAFATTGHFTWSYASVHGGGYWEGARVTAQFPDPGHVGLTLTAVDDAGNSASASFALTVNDTTPPLAHAGADLTAFPGQEVLLTAALSVDNDAEFLTAGRFEWTVHDAQGTQLLVGLRHIVVFDDPGLFKVELDAWDPTGLHAQAPDVMYVRVVDEWPPVPSGGGDRTVEVGASVPFSAAGTHDNDPTVMETGTFVWEFQDGAERKALHGADAAYVFERAGVYSVRLTVTDAAGNMASVVFKVTVVDGEGPVLRVAPIPEEVASGIAVVLDAANSTDNGGALRFLWRVEGPAGFLWQLAAARGDVVLTYAGVYRITVTATDAAGNAASREFNVTVVKAAGGGLGGGTGGSSTGGGGGTAGGGGPTPGGGGLEPSAGASGGIAISAAVLGAAGAAALVAAFIMRRWKH